MSITIDATKVDLYQKLWERLHIVEEDIIKFCQKWRIIEFGVFGSVIRDDFRDDSDVDILVTFAPEVKPKLLDRLDMQEEIETLFGRPVDIVQKSLLKNPYLRAEVLSSCLMIYDNK
jgi:predicted nucleotidyltransferase